MENQHGQLPSYCTAERPESYLFAHGRRSDTVKLGALGSARRVNQGITSR